MNLLNEHQNIKNVTRSIKISNLSKSFGEVQALKDISLEVKPGELFGLIGPDGAGKTTLFRVLTTLMLADEGKAEVLGYDVVKDYRKIRQSIGYMPGRFSLYQDLTVEENLQFFATIFGTTISENYDLIKDIYQQIEPFKDRRAGKLSGGMKQKLALSCALIHYPEVLFLDEPTTGVDAVSRTEFWNMLYKIKEKGISIMVSTPYMDEAVRCDSIALIQDGKILSVDTPEGIRDDFPHHLYSLKGRKQYQLLKAVKAWGKGISVFPFGQSLHLAMEEPLNESQLLSYCNEEGIEAVEIEKIQPDIEDCFMNLSSNE